MKFNKEFSFAFCLVLIVLFLWVSSYKNFKNDVSVERYRKLEFSNDVLKLIEFEEELTKIRELVDDITIEEKRNSLNRNYEKSNENIKVVEKIVEKKIFIYDEHPHKPWKNQQLHEYIGEFGRPDSNSCQKKEHIYFLKTSKTGGTTFANILQRFG